MHNLTKGQKRALRKAAELAHERDRSMAREDRDVYYLEARTGDLWMIVGGAVLHGWITIGEIGEAAREMMADVVDRLRKVKESIESDPPLEESDPFTADAVVSLEAIVREMDLLGPETNVYLNRNTGEVYAISSEELEWGDDLPEDDDDLPDWQRDATERVRQIRDSEDWIEMPSQFDLDEYRAMTKFTWNQRPSVSKALDETLHGRGAFRRFRHAVRELGLADEWDTFRHVWVTRVVRNALESRGIPFRR